MNNYLIIQFRKNQNMSSDSTLNQTKYNPYKIIQTGPDSISVPSQTSKLKNLVSR